MKKLLLLFTVLSVLSCSSDETQSCPNGKIKGYNTVQDRNFLTLDNGQEITIGSSAKEFEKYPLNSCYEGLK